MCNSAVNLVADFTSPVTMSVINNVNEIEITRHEITLTNINPIPSDRDYGNLSEIKLEDVRHQAT